ncbi:MAG: N-6 DNA methylase [Chloroflexota bacterium]|nr:N-6 DNA methylase [Chloroflexota bacterium]
MTDARSTIETLTLPIADQLVQAMSTTTDEDFVQWAELHGWNKAVDKRMVAHQAALNLVLRALICHCRGDDDFPTVVPADFILTHSNSLLQNLGISPQPSSYLDHLAIQAGVTLKKSQIAALVSALQREREDVIGAVYTSWVSQDARRTLGQFWTPQPIAQLMTWWAIRSPSDCVLDPAFGSGILLLMATDRLTLLGTPAKAILRQMAGAELSPLVFLMGLTNVLLQHVSRARLRLQWGDFLMPKREPYTMLKESSVTYATGARQMALPGMKIIAPTVFPDQFEAIVCNPPYTRHHHLPEAYKSSWANVMKQEYGIRLSRFSSLFAYFFVQASRMLSPAGRMAFITPATVFEASYSSQVKTFIRRQLRLRAIVGFDESLSVFEGVDTAACITLVEGPDAPARDQSVHVQIRKWPGVEPVLQMIEQGSTVTTDWGSSREIDLSALEPHRKWTVIGRENSRFDNECFVPLSTLARVMRGIATGANNFFVLSDDEVIEWGLNQANLRPVLTKTREAPEYVFSQADFDRLGREGKKRWLLYLTGPVTPGTAEARYIQHGETLGLHQRSLVKTRSLWYLMEQRDPAPIYFTYLSRKRSRFIHNQTNVLALNVFLCVYPAPAISQDETTIKALLAMLNSLIAKDSLRHVGRTYGGDTIKIEPREMDRMPVMNPIKLAVSTREILARLFDQLCHADSKEAEKVARQTIDEEIAQLLVQ